MISRREMLWMSMLAGGSSVLSRKGRRSGFPNSFWANLQSPPTTPFVRPLPFPMPPEELAAFRIRDCEAPFPDGFSQPIQFHKLVEEEHLVELHPDLPKTPIWRYRDRTVRKNAHGDQFGAFMAGPTILAQMNRPIAGALRRRRLGRKRRGKADAGEEDRNEIDRVFHGESFRDRDRCARP